MQKHRSFFPEKWFYKKNMKVGLILYADGEYGTCSAF